MLKSGAEHLESLRDGRVVYIGRERVDDVTTHPAFRNAARTPSWVSASTWSCISAISGGTTTAAP